MQMPPEALTGAQPEGRHWDQRPQGAAAPGAQGTGRTDVSRRPGLHPPGVRSPRPPRANNWKHLQALPAALESRCLGGVA